MTRRHRPDALETLLGLPTLPAEGWNIVLYVLAGRGWRLSPARRLRAEHPSCGCKIVMQCVASGPAGRLLHLLYCRACRSFARVDLHPVARRPRRTSHARP